MNIEKHSLTTSLARQAKQYGKIWSIEQKRSTKLELAIFLIDTDNEIVLKNFNLN